MDHPGAQFTVDFVVSDLMSGPEELRQQLPARSTGVCELPEHHGGRFWCVQLASPVQYRLGDGQDVEGYPAEYLDTDTDGTFLWVYVLALHFHEDTRLPADIGYVIDVTLCADDEFNEDKVDWVATGLVETVDPSRTSGTAAPAPNAPRADEVSSAPPSADTAARWPTVDAAEPTDTAADRWPTVEQDPADEGESDAGAGAPERWPTVGDAPDAEVELAPPAAPRWPTDADRAGADDEHDGASTGAGGDTVEAVRTVAPPAPNAPSTPADTENPPPVQDPPGSAPGPAAAPTLDDVHPRPAPLTPHSPADPHYELRRRIDAALARLAGLVGMKFGPEFPRVLELRDGDAVPADQPVYYLADLAYRSVHPTEGWVWRTAADPDELLYWIVDDVARWLAYRWARNAPAAAAMTRPQIHAELFTPYWLMLLRGLDPDWHDRTARTIEAYSPAKPQARGLFSRRLPPRRERGSYRRR